jgi:plastocyanin
MPRAARRPSRLLALAAAVALLGACLLLAAGGPAAAQAQAKAEVKGTADNKWDPADVNIRPGGTVTFTVAGGATHPVVSGDGSNPQGDNRFDDSDCALAKMQKVGDSCSVKIDKAGSYPYFCQIHVALGMKGTITVGSGGGQASTTTGADAAGGGVVEPPTAAAPPPAGRPAIYWAGWGLFALGALMALALIALYVRFAPGFNRQKR